MFHFIKLRKIWYLLSIAVIVPGIISLALHGLNLGIDFTGGSIMELRSDKAVSAPEVRTAVDAISIKGDKSIQQSGNRTYLIKTVALSQADSDKMFAGLQDKLGKATLMSDDYVGPVIGKELAYNALLALLIASVLMVIYITFRFEFKQGIAAIIALLHDVLVVTGIFSLLRIQVDSTFVAAILTIIGYSINDTIVIFDRIRENQRMQKKGELLEDLVNKSLWQTLGRSINTVLTVLFVLLGLYLLGGSTIRTFSLALLIGVSSGAYSSIFNASPLWVDFKLLEKKKKSNTARAA